MPVLFVALDFNETYQNVISDGLETIEDLRLKASVHLTTFLPIKRSFKNIELFPVIMI